LNQSIAVWYSGLGCEVIHFIIENEAEFACCYGGAKAVIQRGRNSHGISLRVHD
jgi:hypothetical protein